MTKAKKARAERPAAVTLNPEIWTDPRFERLAEYAGVDLDSAIGKCARVWAIATDRGSSLMPSVDVELHARRPGFADAMVRAGLAGEREAGELYLKGSEGRIEWLGHYRELGRAGGQKSAAKRRGRTPPNGTPSGQPSGQAHGQPHGQAHATPYGQPHGQPGDGPATSKTNGQAYGQPYGQPSGQPYGQPSGQAHGQPLGQAYGQGSLKPSSSLAQPQDQDPDPDPDPDQEKTKRKKASELGTAEPVPRSFFSSELPEPERTQVSSRKRQKLEPDPEAEKIGGELADAIRSHSPDALVSPAAWAREIGLAMRRDGRTPEQLRRAIAFAHRSPQVFWRANVLSGAKLRQHCDRLLIQANAERYEPAAPAAPDRVTRDDRFTDRTPEDLRSDLANIAYQRQQKLDAEKACAEFLAMRARQDGIKP